MSQIEPQADQTRYGLPPGIARRYLEYFVGFIVAVPLGLAAVIGKVPGVDALIDLLPRGSRGTLIILSTFVLGTATAVIQYLAGAEPSKQRVGKYFRVVLVWLIASFLLLFLFHSLFVEVVSVRHQKGSVAVIVGADRIKGPPCGCSPTDSDLQCILELSLSEAAIESCWDHGSIKLRRNLLNWSYVFVMGAVGGLIGVLVLQFEERSRAKRRRRAAARAAAKRPPGQLAS